MVTAQQPNIPITQVENATNISTGEADVANAAGGAGRGRARSRNRAAKLAESEANNARAQADLARYKILIAKEEVSQQEYDQSSPPPKRRRPPLPANSSALESAAQMVDQSRAQVAEAQSRLAQYRRNAPQQMAIRRGDCRIGTGQRQNSAGTGGTGAAEAELHQNRRAGCRHRHEAVGRSRRAHRGRPAALTIAQIDDLWVTANFKETQLRNIRPGQSATHPRGCAEARFRRLRGRHRRPPPAPSPAYCRRKTPPAIT